MQALWEVKGSRKTIVPQKINHLTIGDRKIWNQGGYLSGKY